MTRPTPVARTKTDIIRSTLMYTALNDTDATQSHFTSLLTAVTFYDRTV